MYSENEYEEYAKRMETSFPKMFTRPYGGFAIGPGWWDIVEDLCKAIQNHIDWNNGRPDKEPIPQVTVVQIKEKFGGLRFYYDGGDDYINGMVAMAEDWASRSCEVCGNKGDRRAGGWIRTLCDTHYQESKRK